MKSLLEWYLRIPPAAPGEGTDWVWLWRRPWPASWPAWWVVLVGLACAAVVIWSYRRDAATLSRGRRLSLTGLRLLVIAFAVLLLTELSVSVHRTGLPGIALLIDTSASMSLQDQPGTEITGAVPKGDDPAGLADGAPHRLQRAIELLTREDADWLHRVQSSHQLHVWQFSETAVPLLGGGTVKRENETQFLQELQGLRPTGDQTRPAPAVRKVLSELRGMPPAALIVLTDGISSAGEADRFSRIADTARRKGVPLYLIGVGSEEPVRDLQLYDTLVDEVAFVGDPLPISAKLKSFGFAGRDLEVRLRREGSDEILQKTTIKAGPDGQPLKFELSYVPTEAGEEDLILEVVLANGETNDRNNAEVRHVSVREEKIRVLLADGLPRYEYRALKHLLERDKSIQLSVVLQDADLEYPQEDRVALPHLPVQREELLQYDVIILGDLDPGQLSPALQENLREFVREKGGGLILIAGPRHNPRQFQGTPLESLFPFDLADVSDPSAELTRSGFQPALTLEGQRGNSLFRFAESEPASLAIWNSLPPLYWQVEIAAIKPGVNVFAEHPLTRKSEIRLPTILLQRIGAGKVLFHATDETWRWRFRTGDLYFGRYWVQAIRFLSRGRLIGRDRAAELSIDRLVYQRGEPVQLRVRFLDDRQAPAEADGVTVLLERQGEGQRSVKLTRVPQAPSLFEGQVSQLPEGAYHAWVARPSFSAAPPAADFRVEAPLLELQRRSLDRTDLQLAAQTSQGRYYPLDEADRLPDDLPEGAAVTLATQDPIPLWNRPEVLLLFVALLAAEWLLRKRWRLV